ncbi:hypothetical protein ANOM_010984 [Aspergillus nomiae NRRL 13137]|uniref:Phosphoesterase family protein n=1 Tax=Aspergillus nomiae NRRL (strain ATCC 15546 / NRRL 13137 / CBS 260.88 / M93) TaxID=1509407 RepID=A0A0L1IN18_ASPN3|nr:uncharacterized protein ANOM_010984 [Aspergillus nomiae NRRL 13137]KNG80583.1 hypothetical protein ANOM_010984 [Aspergillus nomiae NRRL 13137]
MPCLGNVASVLALVSTATAQYALPANEVPYTGGNVFKQDDPAVASYPFSYKPPFEPEHYHGYYSWSVNNDTVSGSNFTGYSAKDSYLIPDGATGKFPFFLINEGTPKTINSSKLFKTSPSPNNACADNQCEGKFKKILHIIFENEVYDWTMGQAYWKLLATRGKLLRRSYAITHPSLPNYAAIVAGDFFGMAHEDFYHVNATTIYDLLEDKGVSYGTYAEWYNPIATHRGPNDCNNYMFNGPIDNTNPTWWSQVYRRLDVPALLFSSYTSRYDRCSKIYSANNTFTDHVMSHTLPEYSFYVPDMLHNAHDPTSDSNYFNQPNTGGEWLNSFLDLYLPELEAQGTLVVATFDEATWWNDDDASPNNDNHITTILFGAGITPNTTDDSYLTLYGMLRGAIQNFGLGSLGRNDTNTTNGNLFDLVDYSHASKKAKLAEKW